MPDERYIFNTGWSSEACRAVTGSEAQHERQVVWFKRRLRYNFYRK